ncbi:galactokinase family protein [soil metagenome]
MTGASLAARLAGAGFDPEGIPAKRRLADAVLLKFFGHADGAPDGAWWTPGRLEVFGKHTDYAGGHTLIAAVPHGFLIVARRRPDGVVRLADARRHEALTLTPDVHGSSAQSYAGWRNYAAVVVRRLARNFPGAAYGGDIVFASDLPSASGMSSSSALVVGLAAAIAEVARLRDRPEWRENLPDPHAEAGYYACIENGKTFGSLQGDDGVGTQGGSEDHVAIVCGRPGVLSTWRFMPVQPVEDVPLPQGWTFVVASSGVAARKTGEAMGAYNRLSAEVADLLGCWNAGEPAAPEHQEWGSPAIDLPAPSLRAALETSPSAEERLLARIKARRHDPLAARALEHRLSHFLREDSRVLEAAAAFRKADRHRLGALSHASQQDAEMLLGNGVPETIELARSARELGAFAASSFGAGFGGSVWALVESGEAAVFATRWLAGYQSAFPARAAAATVFIARPAPGVRRLG